MIARPRRIGVRLSEEERQRIWDQADSSLLSVSEFIRRRALGKQIVSRSDLRVLAELRRLGGLLKHIHLETRGSYSRDTANAIQALESYARLLRRNLEKGGVEEPEPRKSLVLEPQNQSGDSPDRQNST
jgi:hypothetical protein